MAPTSPLYRALFVIGGLVVGGGIALGVGISLRQEQRLPPVPLNQLIDPYLEEVEAMIDAGDDDKALRQLKIAALLRPDEAAAPYNRMGRLQLDRGESDAAIDSFRRALRADATDAEAYNNLAVAYARAGDLDLALASVRQAVRLAPDWEAARSNLQEMQRQAQTPGARQGDDEPSGSAEITVGRAAARLFYRGETAQLHGRFTPRLSDQLSLEALERMHLDVFRQLGAETERLSEEVIDQAGSKLYVRRARFERWDGEVEVVVQLAVGDAPDGSPQIDGLMFRPVS